MAAVRDKTEWMTAPQAAAVLNCGPQLVRKLGARGILTTFSLPGAQTRYSSESVQRLAKASVRLGLAEAV
jgi:hypothetical protein